MRLNRFLLVGLACMPCLAAAQKVTLRLNPPAGRTYVYTGALSNAGKAGAMDMSMSQTYSMSMKVLSNANGKITFQSKISDVKITVPPGSPMAGSAAQMKKMMESQSSSSTFDNRYRVVKLNTAGGNAMAQGMAQGMSGAMGGMATFPDGPVGVGSKWSNSMDMGKLMGRAMPGMATTGKIPITMQLVRFLNVGGKRCAEISMKMAGTMNMTTPSQGGRKGMAISTKISSNGTSVVDLATGIFVRMSSTTVTDTAFGAQSFRSTQKMSMSLKG